MAIYTFINGKKKYAFTYNPRVCINGVIKKIVEGYTFINGVKHKLFGEWSFENDMLCTSDKSLLLPAGTYDFILRAGGGAGGTTGRASTNSSGTGVAGSGGAGGKGELVVERRTLAENTIVDIYVGDGGLTITNGGNGGKGGGFGDRYYQGGTGIDSVNGCGGGGGKPSFVVIDEEVISANAGGGGGGGGGGAGAGRYSGGAASGAGGGYYKIIEPISETKNHLNTDIVIFLSMSGNDYVLSTTAPAGEILAQWNIEQKDIDVDEEFVSGTNILKVNNISGDDITFGFYNDDSGIAKATITVNNVISEREKIIPQYESVAGQDGVGGGGGYYKNGANGLDGNTEDFPDISSGRGGTSKGGGGAAAQGASASGGGGGYGSGNHSSAYGAAGGGGAGGSLDAGGGFGGRTGYAGADATNAKTEPTDTLSENSLYGVNAKYGMGGGVNQNGSKGFVLIRRIS